MKKTIVLISALFFSATSLFAASKTEKIKVSGNCGQCAKTIETAAKKAGASSATWDKKSKVLTVTYDDGKTNNEAIQKGVAASGYDTEKFVGDMKAYKNLHSCCQYDGKK